MLKIVKITILTGSGPDHLILHTDLPEGCFPYKNEATARMDVASGSGESYAEKHFPDVSCEVIKI